MTIQELERDGEAVIRLAGRMDAAAVAALDGACERAAATGARQVTVELADLTYISSVGIGALIRLAGVMRVRLVAPNGLVRSVLEITGVLPLFEITE